MKDRLPQLDGIRGIAILVVMLHNSLGKFPSLPLQRLFSFGWMGVDLFFVLSGFLITGILVDTKQSEGYFKNFFARRCLRIWPLYYAVLILMFIVIPLARPGLASTIQARSSPWWAYPFFLQNFLVFHSAGAIGPLGVTWSVAIEEQFYVVWAVVVRYCSEAQLRLISAAVICLTPVLRLYLSLHHVDLYSNVFCRLDGLMAGGLLALLIRSGRVRPSKSVNSAWLCFVAALSLAFLAESYGARWITFSCSTAASAAFLYLALFETNKLYRLMLTNRWLVYTGTISYGLYLLHKIPFDMVQFFHLDRHPALALAGGLAASYAIAILSWNFFEQPFLRWKKFFESGPRTSAMVEPASPTRLASANGGALP